VGGEGARQTPGPDHEPTAGQCLRHTEIEYGEEGNRVVEVAGAIVASGVVAFAAVIIVALSQLLALKQLEQLSVLL